MYWNNATFEKGTRFNGVMNAWIIALRHHHEVVPRLIPPQSKCSDDEAACSYKSITMAVLFRVQVR